MITIIIIITLPLGPLPRYIKCLNLSKHRHGYPIQVHHQSMLYELTGPSKISCSWVLHTSFRDRHYPIYAVGKVSVTAGKSHKYISYNDYSNDDLAKLPWKTLKHCDDPENLCNTWKNIFLSAADQYAPPETKRVHEKVSPWLTRNITALIVKRDKAKLNAQKRNDSKLR